MIKEKRFLITTADERTWKFDRPVIFLGEWCRIHERKHIWQEMDAVVAQPYGLGKENKDADFVEARELEEKLFFVLCSVLNQYHQTQHGERFWRIVLGHWFRRFVEVVLNRFRTLEQCLQSYDISGTMVYVNNQYSLATLDSYSAIWAFNDDRWNNTLNRRILEILRKEDLIIKLVSGCALPGFRFNQFSSPFSLKKTLRNWSYKHLSILMNGLVRDSDAFIVNSYLPIKEEIKLQFALRQCPQLWRTPKYDVTGIPDRTLRESLFRNIKNNSSNNLENILNIMMFELLPVSYLEDFGNLNKFVEQQPWPRDPKIIFTSNNFDTDEVFKLWAATKVESGSKYFIGQHGNNYGTYRYMCPTVEEVTADKFLTWGWTDGLPQQLSAFVFKTVGKKALRYNPKGGLLIIEACLSHRITTWDITAEFGKYFQQQQEFVSDIINVPKHEIVIRLHSGYKYLNWNEIERWRAFDSSIKIETGAVAISHLIARSRLVVHSYDSTGILESMSQNIPTIAFWDNGFDHLRDSAIPYYKILHEVGIVHFSPKTVASKINEIWPDVDKWWLSSDVQNARRIFCERYAKTSKSPLSELKAIFQS